MLRRGYVQVINYLKDALFPFFCLACEAEGAVLCNECLNNLAVSGIFCCPGCHVPSEGGAVCAKCIDTSALAGHIALLPYQETDPVGRLIQALKYNYVEAALDPFEYLVKDFVARHPALFASIEAIVPVPLHARRYAERGFNQAELIATKVAEALHKPMIPLLRRDKHTAQQAKLNKVERQKNVHLAFVTDTKIKNAYRSVLLVDDVFTTGSTMQECTRALRAAGVGRVVGFSLARG